MSVPFAFLPYQQRWVEDPSPVKFAEKSRRVGLTWAEAADAALTAAAQKGMDVWYVGYNKDMAQEFVRDVGDWAKAYQLAAGEIEQAEEVFKDGNEDKSILAFIIRFASGFRVTALSSRPSNLRGKQGRVIIDEAAFHENLDELLKAALALLMWGGQVRVISTHNGSDNPFNEFILNIRNSKLPYSLHRITLDDALEDGLYQRICLVRGKAWSAAAEQAWREDLVKTYGDGAGEELFCIPRGGGGKFLSLALIESCLGEDSPVLRLSKDDAFGAWEEHLRQADVMYWLMRTVDPWLASLPEDVHSFVGEDFGRSGDLTVIVPMLEHQGLRVTVPFMVELRNIPFRQQETVLFHILDRLPRFMGGALDARGNGQYLAEVAMQRYGGERIAQVMLTEGWYREHMPPFKAALEDGSLSGIPKDGDVLEDLRSLEMVRGVARVADRRRTEAGGGQRHGDAAIALALGWYARRCVRAAPIEFRATGQKMIGLDGWLPETDGVGVEKAGKGWGSVPGLMGGGHGGR